jgi:hypothetical protein
MTLIALTWTQHYIGMSKFFLDNTTMRIPSIPNRYFTAIRHFMSRFQLRLQLQQPATVPLLRVQDQYIMDIAVQHGWADSKLDCINACRRYLQATTLADIANDRGNEITDDAWNGTRHVSQVNFRDIMFNQQKPTNPTAWRHWQNFLRKLCDQHHKLKTPLGHWIVDANKLRHPTTWVYNPQLDQLYKWVGGHHY